jgi:hypothetical protein
MLGIDAGNGGLPLIGRVATWLMLPLVAGGLTALPAASAPAGPVSPAASAGTSSNVGCSAQQPCLADALHAAAGRDLDSDLLLPGAPSGVTATASDGQAEVNWTASRTAGGLPISQYLVTSSPPGATMVVSGGKTRALVNGLPNGQRFTFTVAAADADGQGPASAPSNGVTPASLSSFTSTVSLRSVTAMFNGGACLDQGTQCFGIQQNSFVDSATDGEYWIQNVVFVEDTVQHGWVAEGNYEIWNGTQQSILACSGSITFGPHGEFCQWSMDWRPLTFPTRITLTSTVNDGDVVLGNSLGDVFPPWSPGGPGGVQFIVDLHQAAVPSLLSMYAPETVIVGETGRHNATFVGGSGSIASQVVLANGQGGVPQTQCVAQSSDTSTGETGVGFYWSTVTRGGATLLDFTTIHRSALGSGPGDGEGVKVLPGFQECA